MESYLVALAGFGALVLLTAWLPMALKQMSLSLPICCVAIGAVLSVLPGLDGVAQRPERQPDHVERRTEFVVIVSLMGAGLKID